MGFNGIRPVFAPLFLKNSDRLSYRFYQRNTGKHYHITPQASPRCPSTNMHAMTNPSDLCDSSSLGDHSGTSPVTIRPVFELLSINQDPLSFLLVSLCFPIKNDPQDWSWRSQSADFTAYSTATYTRRYTGHLTWCTWYQYQSNHPLVLYTRIGCSR